MDHRCGDFGFGELQPVKENAAQSKHGCQPGGQEKVTPTITPEADSQGQKGDDDNRSVQE